MAGDSGEVKFEVLDEFFKRVLPYYQQAEAARRDGRSSSTWQAPRSHATPLRFPGKVLADEAGKRLFIADSNHNRIVIATSTASCST